jgi:hypothetical protein
MVPTKRIWDIQIEDFDQAIHVRMKDLVWLDEKHWHAMKILIIYDYSRRKIGMTKGNSKVSVKVI